MDAITGTQLPQLTSSRCFLSDGGLETTLIYRKGIDLPEFASFPLVTDPEKSQLVEACMLEYVKVALEYGTGIVLETPTWRASLPWIRKLGYPDSDVHLYNRAAVQMFTDIRTRFATAQTPIVISGNLGPLGDAYSNAGAAEDGLDPRDSYAGQIASLAAAGVDMIGLMTISRVDEAVAGVLLARQHSLPVWVSCTVETDGTLPNGHTIAQFIKSVDDATDGYASYFGVNCAHPKHILHALRTLPPGEHWAKDRIGEVRANASEKSHEELDESTELDRGNVAAFGEHHRELADMLPNLRVVGGCCGTDEEHIREIAKCIL